MLMPRRKESNVSGGEGRLIGKDFMNIVQKCRKFWPPLRPRRRRSKRPIPVKRPNSYPSMTLTKHRVRFRDGKILVSPLYGGDIFESKVDLATQGAKRYTHVAAHDFPDGVRPLRGE